MQLDSLYDYAEEYNVTLTDDHLQKFSLFLDCLEEWDRKMNLVGTSDPDRIIIELLLDSLIPEPLLPSEDNMVDIGSGAGFPGIIIKILKPGLNVRLIESNGKKVSFLKYVIRSLGLKNITTINERVETVFDSLNDEEIKLITSRAMIDLQGLIKLCGTILTRGSVLVAFLGSKWKRELDKNKKLMQEQNFFLKNSVKYKLPEKSNERAVVFLTKR